MLQIPLTHTHTHTHSISYFLASIAFFLLSSCCPRFSPCFMIRLTRLCVAQGKRTRWSGIAFNQWWRSFRFRGKLWGIFCVLHFLFAVRLATQVDSSLFYLFCSLESLLWFAFDTAVTLWRPLSPLGLRVMAIIMSNGHTYKTSTSTTSADLCLPSTCTHALWPFIPRTLGCFPRDLYQFVLILTHPVSVAWKQRCRLRGERAPVGLREGKEKVKGFCPCRRKGKIVACKTKCQRKWGRISGLRVSHPEPPLWRRIEALVLRAGSWIHAEGHGHIHNKHE